jgi:hypothetical protein
MITRRAHGLSFPETTSQGMHLKMVVDAHCDDVVVGLNVGVVYFVFAVEIFVTKIGRPIRRDFEIHPGDKLTRDGNFIFVDDLDRTAGSDFAVQLEPKIRDCFSIERI